MSDQPREDFSTRDVLLVIAVLLAILATGVAVLVYERLPAAVPPLLEYQAETTGSTS